jgi:uncharacterized FAD-dependent dehydrogenase
MLRLTELRLPLNHSEEELRAAILKELGIEGQDLVRYSIFRRIFDARKRGAIALIYHIDAETPRETEIGRLLYLHLDTAKDQLRGRTAKRTILETRTALLDAAAETPIVAGGGDLRGFVASVDEFVQRISN